MARKEEEPPVLELRHNEDGSYRYPDLPPLEDQARPRKLVLPSGEIEMEALPLFNCLLAMNEEEAADLLPSPESYGNDDSDLNQMAWAWNYDKMLIFLPDQFRYGRLPSWFPTTDNEGHRLTEVAQVDRFLFLLGHVISLPEDHSQIDARTLVTGLFELHEAYEDGAFWDWDEEGGWARTGPT